MTTIDKNVELYKNNAFLLYGNDSDLKQSILANTDKNLSIAYDTNTLYYAHGGKLHQLNKETIFDVSDENLTSIEEAVDKNLDSNNLKFYWFNGKLYFLNNNFYELTNQDLLQNVGDLSSNFNEFKSQIITELSNMQEKISSLTSIINSVVETLPNILIKVESAELEIKRLDQVLNEIKNTNVAVNQAIEAINQTNESQNLVDQLLKEKNDQQDLVDQELINKNIEQDQVDNRHDQVDAELKEDIKEANQNVTEALTFTTL